MQATFSARRGARPLLLSAVAAAALLAGCSFIPKYERPAAPVPAAYPAAGAAAPATAGTPAADIDWRAFFPDPRLQQLIAICLLYTSPSPRD